MNTANIHNIFESLRLYSEKEGFKGYDPFDGLNSRLFQSLPFFKNSTICRLLWLQLFKRSPFNARKIVGIEKGYNPKGLGLFLSGYCCLYRANQDEKILESILFIIEKIKDLKTDGYSGACWGYNFDWQARAFFQPKGTPSVVVTSYVSCALLDAYEVTQDKILLETARSACDFVMNDLHRSEEANDSICFSYSPLDKTKVYNASLLGGRLLSRVYEYTKEEILINTAKKTVRYVCDNQNEDGSWNYSPLPYHSWIDNFHTGYNLECIYTYQEISKDMSFNSSIKNGLEYYLNTFFEDSGLPKYYNNSRYPVDMHNTAQLIILSKKLGFLKKEEKLINKVLSWSIENMFDAKRGYFYYNKEKYFTTKIPYIRWVQAWMFLGLSTYLSASNQKIENE